MSLKAAPHHLVVTPTGDNHETERGSLIVVNDTDRRIYRGVVEHVGAHMPEDEVVPGCVAHYTSYYAVGDRHVVPVGNFIAWEESL